MPTVAKYAHITFNASGTAVIKGSRIKVPILIAAHLAYKWDAEQLRIQYPDLTLGQIHSALAYYYDHKEQIDREMRDRLRRVDEHQAKQKDSPLLRRLRRLKRERAARG